MSTELVFGRDQRIDQQGLGSVHVRDGASLSHWWRQSECNKATYSTKTCAVQPCTWYTRRTYVQAAHYQVCMYALILMNAYQRQQQCVVYCCCSLAFENYIYCHGESADNVHCFLAVSCVLLLSHAYAVMHCPTPCACVRYLYVAQLRYSEEPSAVLFFPNAFYPVFPRFFLYIYYR